ncbi:hypothetical protein D0T90_05785 [Neisseria animalis]|uniref:Uncharacterized protein n=2 Tax=Neisseria animalis TaxID=492 RepID=A0A5P3MR63_NEIAN|nr:hypothetical protein D0T90_05785 [Neisseria animalis]
MALMGIMVLIFSYQLYDWIKKTGAFGVESHIQHLLFVISTICCIIFFYKFNNKYFHKNILSTKVYALAQTLDFYSNKACKLPKDLENGKFIYIDPNHQYVLVDNTSIEQQDVWGIIRYGVKNNEENDFINFDINPEKPKLSIQKCIS